MIEDSAVSILPARGMRHGRFGLNRRGRDFFVGDLHGMYDAFLAAQAEAGFDAGRDRVFSVGDLIDRGPDSARCLRLLARPWFHAVKGNHEEMMLGGQPEDVWMMNGGTWIEEYDDGELRELGVLARARLFDKITVATRCGRIGVVHADAIGPWQDIGPGQRDARTDTAAITWGRKRHAAGLADPVEGVDAVVVGHSIVDGVRVLGNVVYIDTGACFAERMGGRLTMLEAEEVMAAVAGARR